MAKADKILEPVVPGTPAGEAAAVNADQTNGDDPVLDAGGEATTTTDDGIADYDDTADFLEEPIIEPGGDVSGAKDETIKAQQQEINRLTAQLKASGQVIPSRKDVSEANLPDQKDVDRTKIHDRVLTKQGWVLPAVNNIE